MKHSLNNNPIHSIRVLRRLLLALGLFLLLVLLSVTVPYAFDHPQVSEDYIHWVAETDFTDTTPGIDRVRLLTENEAALEERIRLISQAEERIIYVTFDFRADSSGKDVMALLLEAAERGVDVQILIDGMTTVAQLPNAPYFQALAAQPNVEIRRYNPVNLLRPLEVHGRMHDKYMIVDEDYYLLGGRNTYDYFIGGYPTEHPSQDLEVLVWNTAGDERQGSMTQLVDYFNGVWTQERCVSWYEDESLLSRSDVQAALSELEDHYFWMRETYPDAFSAPEDGAGTVEAGGIHLLSNPIYTTVKEPQVLYAMTAILSSAQEEVYIQTPYAVCNDAMYDSFRQIGQSVPSAALLLNSVETGDNLMASSDYLRSKGDLLETGISVWEYAGHQSCHSKCAVADGAVSMVGSFNWDMRSAYLDTELMLVIPGEEFAALLMDYETGLLTESRLCADGGRYDETSSVMGPEGHLGKTILLSILQVLTGPVRYLL